MSDSGKTVSTSETDPISSRPLVAIESSTTTANATTVSTTSVNGSVKTAPAQTTSSSKPSTDVQATAVATTSPKSETTIPNTASENKGRPEANVVAISEAKPKSGATPTSPRASNVIAKTDSASNEALVSTNIERSTTTLTETSTVTSTSTEWRRTQTPSGTTRYNEITEVKVQSDVDTKTITKEKSTLAITMKGNTTAESSTNEDAVSKSTGRNAVIPAGVGLVQIDNSSSVNPQIENSEISNKENEVPTDKIEKPNGSMKVSIIKKESDIETGSENGQTGNALEVILLTDDGNKKPEKSTKLEESDKKSNKKSERKKQKKLKSPKMSGKDLNIVKKYNREY